MVPDNSRQRSRLLQKNIYISFAMKVCSAVIVLLMVPLTLNCLGEYTNGVWLTISSLLLWIDNMDIGLGNGMRNKLAILMAHDETDKARSLVASTFAMLTCIMVPTILVLVTLIMTCDTYTFLNVATKQIQHLDQVLIVTVVLVCSTFIFKLIGNVYMGLQLPAVSNMLITLGQLLALAATYVIWLNGSHSLLHIALANTMAPFLVYLLAMPYTFFIQFPQLRPSLRLVSLKVAREVMDVGIQFFVIQISGVILFMTSNILISKLFSPAMVTPYQIAYRYFSLFLVIFTVICVPYWNATTDAYEKGDFDWIRSATRRMSRTILLILLGMIVMLLLSDPIYTLWVGDQTQVDFKMSAMIALYIFILIYSMRYSYFINGIGKLRLQLIFTAAAALIFIPLAYAVTLLTHDIYCFLGVMCAVNIPGLIINRMQFYKIINKKATGLWNK